MVHPAKVVSKVRSEVYSLLQFETPYLSLRHVFSSDFMILNNVYTGKTKGYLSLIFSTHTRFMHINGKKYMIL